MLLPPVCVFTSESVSPGHPDKIADQISDAILDEILAQDKTARVACECLVKTGMVLIAGEITTHAWVDFEDITRRQLAKIGYNDPHLGFESESCAVISAIGKQSSDIAVGVSEVQGHEQGAGDQGFMVGFATNETPSFMPMPIVLAHALMQQQTLLREQGQLKWLRPDAKAQVSLKYVDQLPVEITSIVVSTQHNEAIEYSELCSEVLTKIITPAIPSHLLTPKTQILINPTGRFVIGGPQGDCGLTGRKIIVDTYGGMARHGGGAFSGKDPSKVDRSAAYMARYIAKNIVAAEFADRCEVQLSYAIGLAQPTSIHVNTFGTGKRTETELENLIKAVFDLRPKAIIERLSLLSTRYLPVATFGHFGRDDLNLPWERLDAVHSLLNESKDH